MNWTINKLTSLVAVVLVAVLLAGVPRSALALSSKKLLIPWGSGPGQLTLVSEEEARNLAFRGPSSVSCSGNSIYILDTREPAIEIFSFNGTYEASVKLPATFKERVAEYSDIVIGSDGTIFVLESEQGIVHRLNRTTGERTLIKIPGSKHATGYTTLSINNNVLSSFDTFSGKIIQFSTDGKRKNTLTSMLFENLVSDGEGNFYGASIRGGKTPNPKKLTLMKLDPSEKKKSVVGFFESDKEINSYAVAGTDDSGKIYVSVSFGGADVTLEDRMLVFKAGHKKARSFKAPSISYKMTMTRPRTVSADGRIIICKPGKKGFQLVVVSLR